MPVHGKRHLVLVLVTGKAASSFTFQANGQGYTPSPSTPHFPKHATPLGKTGVIHFFILFAKRCISCFLLQGREFLPEEMYFLQQKVLQEMHILLPEMLQYILSGAQAPPQTPGSFPKRALTMRGSDLDMGGYPLMATAFPRFPLALSQANRWNTSPNMDNQDKPLDPTRPPHCFLGAS
jgi:hypothetical protein